MIIALSVCIALIIGFYIVDVARNPFPLKKMVIISIFSAAAFVLSLIKFMTMPQGGGVSLVSMLPILLIGIMYGRREGMTAGLVFGALSLLNSPYIVHPAQLFLDYLLCTMMLGLSGIVGTDRKWKLIIGSSIAVILSVGCNVLSGVIFFGQFAPEGMNVWLYSIVYNFSSAGLEGVLSILVLALLPLQTMKKVAEKY